MNNKEKMDAIYRAFQDFIQEQNYFDVVYSEKAGYLRLVIDELDEGAIELDTPETMMEYLCSDVISDVVYAPDNPKHSDNDSLLTEHEKAESRRRLSKIFEAMGMSQERRDSLIDKYIRKYQGILE